MEKLTIGEASRQTGLTSKAIRFYEDGGYIPRASRSSGGYRLYSKSDLQRLRLIRRTRLLGVPLSEVRELLAEAYEGDCAVFAEQLLSVVARRESEIDAQIAELLALRSDLASLREHVSHCECQPGQRLADCDYCVVIDEKGGDSDGCH